MKMANITIANTKVVRMLGRDINGKGFGYAGCFTDKRTNDENMRQVTFRLYNKAEADKLAKKLKRALSAAGYTNEITRTSVVGQATQSYGGEYVRVKAVIG
jgi:hypothetical protein